MSIVLILLMYFLLPFLSGILGGSFIAWRCNYKLMKTINQFANLLEEDMKND